MKITQQNVYSQNPWIKSEAKGVQGRYLIFLNLILDCRKPLDELC